MTTTETEVGFWTLHREAEGMEPITYCTVCALYATNLAFAMNGLEQAKTMTEAVLTYEMVMAMKGASTQGMEITFSETGECSNEFHATMTSNNEEGESA